MRIGVDARCLEEEKISGVGEYALELFENILETDKENEYVFFSNSFKKNRVRFDWRSRYPNTCLKRFRFPNKLLNFFLWYFNYPKLDNLIGRVDVFFAPNINFLEASRECKLAVTFHDLSFERFPEFLTRKSQLWHYFFVNPCRIAQKADRVIAVSESTAKDLEEIYRVNPEKIDIVRHGVSDDFAVLDRNNPKLLEIQNKYGLPHKFVLFLGNVEPRKNIVSVIRAHKKMRKSNPKLEKYKLVLVGNINPLCREIIENEAENIRAVGYIDREDKPFVYSLASLFAYPSFFEGFGLPILEAMACGTPVISSNSSSMPEVAGNAAILVDPNRPDEIEEAMRNLLEDRNLFEKMRERGLRQAEKFSWDKCAKETLEVFSNKHK